MKDYRLSKKKLDKLRIEHRHEKRKKYADRIKGVYLLGMGWNITDIKEALLMDENTLYRYYDTYQSLGLKGLLKNNHKGREEQLTDTEKQELDAHLQQFPSRTTKEVVDFVLLTFEVKYSISGMNALLSRLDYVYKKPQPVPGKYDAQEQKKFIQKYRKIRREMSDDDSLFFMDGVHPHHNPTLQRGWFKRGSRLPVKTGTRYGCLNINAAVDIDTLDVISLEAPRLTEESTLDFIVKLRNKRPEGWIYLVLDNAQYYKTSRIEKAAKLLAIKLIYLPPYSPNLNLIERVWNYMRQHFLYNRYFTSFDEFRRECMSFMKNLRYSKEDLSSLLTENFQKFV